MVAMGCTEMVMGPKTEFGDFEALLQQRAVRANDSTCCRNRWLGGSHEQGYSELAVKGCSTRNW